MKVCKLDENGDWTFDYLQGKEAVAQTIITNLRSFKNDWFYNSEDGLPWFILLGNKGTEGLIEQEVRYTILQSPYVQQITSYEQTLNPETRGLAINFSYIDSILTDQEIEQSIEFKFNI